MLGYHTHNFFCDGEENLEKYVQEAVNHGFKDLGFSSHAPFNFFNKWSIPFDKLNKYGQMIDKLKEQYAPLIRIYKALEIDFIPGKIPSFNFFKQNYFLDYTIGSIHYVEHPESKGLLFIDGDPKKFKAELQLKFDGDLKEAILCYFQQTKQMIQSEKPDIIGHMDKIIKNANYMEPLVDDYPSWYSNAIGEILELMLQENCIMELNLRGLIKGSWTNTFPDRKWLPMAYDMGIPMLVSTDAHHPSELSKFYWNGIKWLKNAGYTHMMQYNGNQWEPYGI